MPPDNNDKYYSLHVHTTAGSIRDSILKIPDYVEKAVQYGLDAVCVTEHGSMSTMYAAANECKKAGIKFIPGMEAYVVKDNSLKEDKKAHHLVLIACNETGLKNLLKIHNQAASEGFYYRPRTDHNHLMQWGEGIIGLSACVGGEIPSLILDNKVEEAVDLALFYSECFDKFYLEIQPGHFKEQINVNKTLVMMNEELGIPLVVTNDVHYLNAEDYLAHNAHVKLGRKDFTDINKLSYPDKVYWFMNKKDLLDNFSFDDIVTYEKVEQAISNTSRIADKCNVTLCTDIQMPKAIIENGNDDVQELYRLVFDEFKKIENKVDNPPEYINRLLKELNVINCKGFCSYFLILYDFVNAARKKGIPIGPGRGSAAGCLVSYVIGITQVDPIKHDLLFERFLDEKRAAIPDVDIDFSSDRRDEMFYYMLDKYGSDHCSLVSTIGYRKAKSAIHDAARLLGYTPAEGNEIAKLIPSVYYGDNGDKETDLSIEQSLKCVPELRKMKRKYPDVFNVATSIEGLPDKIGQHAAGILVAPVSLTDSIPLIKSQKDGIMATSLNLDDAENQFVKYDFLSIAQVRNLQCLAEMTGVDFDYRNEELFSDDDVWKIIGSKNTVGIFQISSPTYKQRMPRLHPSNFDELAACFALIRVPCISSNTDELYMNILNGKAKIKKIHPLYDEITESTLGVLLYQEQIMKIAVAYGMDISTGYRIVKSAAKKKTEELKAYRDEFVTVAIEKNCPANIAHKIFDMIVDSGKYSFNKSHAVAYAYISYAQAWYKVHYPLEFMCNTLTNAYEKDDRAINDAYKEVVRLSIEVLPCDVNKSKWEFTIEGEKIRAGICAIKGIGEKACDIIQQKAPFTDLDDFLKRSGEGASFNKRNMYIAILSGMTNALENIGRREMLLKAMKEKESLTKKEREAGIQIELPAEYKVSSNFVLDINSRYSEMDKQFYQSKFVKLATG